MKIKIAKPSIKLPPLRFPVPAPKQKTQKPKKKKNDSEFSKEKKELLESMKRSSGRADTKLVGKALSFIASLPRIPRERGERILVEKAFLFSEQKHGMQKRLSGDPYFSHSFQTALILSEYGLDSNTIAAALLHDVLEDTEASDEEIGNAFGGEVLKLVKGVTKLKQKEKAKGESEQEEKAYLKSVLAASAEDPRVLLIKLADKIHNLRTIEFMPEKRKKEICETALEVYAPLAERFGLNKMKEEIQDRCLAVLHPQEFESLSAEISKRRNIKEEEINEAIKVLSGMQVQGRKKFFQKYSWRKMSKNVYYYYEKTTKNKKSLDELYDFVSLVVLCNTIGECYEALKTIHTAFYPIPGKLKDLIATPHYMTYQSICTSVIGPKGFPVKIFIRTKEMDELAEKGIAVWLKEKFKPKDEEKELESLAEMAKKPCEPKEFFSTLKTDFLGEQISVFSENGSKYSIPKGSTALDFAFKQNPGKALYALSAEINGKQRPLWHELKSGDRVVFSFSQAKTVSRDWAGFAKTFGARECILKELNLYSNNTLSGKTPLAGYSFSAKPRKGLLKEIFLVLGENASVSSFTVKKVAPHRVEGSLFLELKKNTSIEKIEKKLGKIKGLSEINRI
ncbi:MAG: HD domain-containing protein [Candidatus Diapherotrites archaeon]